MSTAETASTQFIRAKNDINYAYRRFGKKASVPLVLHIHFRGNMDLWDPMLVNTLAEQREVIIFDNTGVGRTSGSTPSKFGQVAADMIAFIDALGLDKIDLFGFSIGGIIGESP
jgi:pimeloyl-ACP methyl ester carboxylesterase